jgi:DNA-binding NarL/FixJ family response regulator
MKLNLLIVDDHQLVREGLIRCFQDKDCVVTGLGDPTEVESWLEENQCDGIVLDMSMPQMNGVELLSRLRQKHPIETLPIVMFTLDATPELRARALKLGANDMISKTRSPYDVWDALIRAVAKR